jgi:hypothetical protein
MAFVVAEVTRLAGCFVYDVDVSLEDAKKAGSEEPALKWDETSA